VGTGLGPGDSDSEGACHRVVVCVATGDANGAATGSSYHGTEKQSSHGGTTNSKWLAYRKCGGGVQHGVDARADGKRR
jgi:hypothetical protein